MIQVYSNDVRGLNLKTLYYQINEGEVVYYYRKNEKLAYMLLTYPPSFFHYNRSYAYYSFSGCDGSLWQLIKGQDLQKEIKDTYFAEVIMETML